MPVTEWGARAASLYSADYARRYRSVDEDIVHGSLVSRFGGWLGSVCESFGREIAALDLGCGTGRYFHALRHVGTLVGIDVSRPMLAEARQPVDAGRVHVPHIELVEGDFLTHAFEEGRFDLVYSIGVLGEHTPFDVTVASRIRRWLAPHGRLAFTAVHLSSHSVPRRWRRRAGEWLMPLMTGTVRSHLRRRLLAGGLYVDDEYVREVLTAAGFAVEQLDRHLSEVHLHTMCVARADTP
ncbi:MAG: class I SAM-dependent methyltransferase [Acidobacteriota bacterium]